MTQGERHVITPAEEARRIPLGVYTSRAGVAPADVPTDVFGPRADLTEPQGASDD